MKRKTAKWMLKKYGKDHENCVDNDSFSIVSERVNERVGLGSMYIPKMFDINLHGDWWKEASGSAGRIVHREQEDGWEVEG